MGRNGALARSNRGTEYAILSFDDVTIVEHLSRPSGCISASRRSPRTLIGDTVEVGVDPIASWSNRWSGWLPLAQVSRHGAAERNDLASRVSSHQLQSKVPILALDQESMPYYYSSVLAPSCLHLAWDRNPLDSEARVPMHAKLRAKTSSCLISSIGIVISATTKLTAAAKDCTPLA